MPKALFFNIPAQGHINPSLPLVTELVRRGHDITYFLTENNRNKIEKTGAKFHPYSTVKDDYFDAPGLDGTRPQYAAYTLMNTTREILPELLDYSGAAKPDYILYDTMCPWGYMVAKTLGLPAVVSMSLMFQVMRSLLNPTAMRFVFSTLTTDFDKGMEANRRSKALGKQYGVPPLSMMSILNAPGELMISYTSKLFQAYAHTLPDNVRFVGRILEDAPADGGFLADQIKGRKVIYASLGSLINENKAFFDACIEAFGGSEFFVIISTGNGIAPEAFGKVPSNISIHNWVPQLEVLKHVSLFITHAGLGSVLDGLYFGVPLLLVPQQEEQSLTAMRVVDLKAGLMLKKSDVNAATIRSRADQLLNDGRYKAEAKRIGDSFRAAGGVKKAVDEIETLLRSKPGATASSASAE